MSSGRRGGSEWGDGGWGARRVREEKGRWGIGSEEGWGGVARRGLRRE